MACRDKVTLGTWHSKMIAMLKNATLESEPADKLLMLLVVNAIIAVDNAVLSSIQ